MRRAFALFGLSATFAVAWISMLPSQALATVTGPCTASIDGVDVTNGHGAPGSAVPLQSGSQVPVEGTAQSRVTDLSYTVHIAGGGVQVGTVTIGQNGLSWSGTVDLESISNATVGLFEVTAEVQTTGSWSASVPPTSRTSSWSGSGPLRVVPPRPGQRGRLILFGRRGTGLSDKVRADHFPRLEARMDDIRA